MAKEKYLSEKPDHIAHCPSCRGVVLRDAVIDSEACRVSFTMRCPHCQEDVAICIENGVVNVKEPTKP